MKRGKNNKWMSILFIGVFLTLMGWAASESRAVGVNYPQRPIQVIIGFQPGSTDMALRPFVEKLPEYLGQPMNFVYKPGASGAVAASFISRVAKPDGYTIFGTGASPIISGPLTKELDYTLDDFVPICRLVISPVIIVVRADSSWKSFKDILEEARNFLANLRIHLVVFFQLPMFRWRCYSNLGDLILPMFPVRALAPQ